MVSGGGWTLKMTGWALSHSVGFSEHSSSRLCRLMILGNGGVDTDCLILGSGRPWT